tara:strand:+ start:1121 stop:1759 length:639 start_codon:yes stop_codon:yes gene_type:complete
VPIKYEICRTEQFKNISKKLSRTLGRLNTFTYINYMKNIYNEESIPSRIDNQVPDKEYPSDKIITINSVDTPSLGDITTIVRAHIIECQKSQINPHITFNFCLDLINHRTVHDLCALSTQKFVALAEYLQDMRKLMPGIQIVAGVRGYFLWCMLPLLFINIPIKVSKYTKFMLPDPAVDVKVTDMTQFLIDNNGDVNITEEQMIQQQLIIKD